MMTDNKEMVERLRRVTEAPGRPYKSDAVRPINPDGHEAATLIEQLHNRVERLAPIVEKVAARRTTREILTGIVGEAHLPPEPSGEGDEFILAARAALTGEPEHKSLPGGLS
jgi:hypothetical protein